MTSLDLASMRGFLGRSISSLNQNKLNGLLAEYDLRRYLGTLGYADRVSRGGWIARRVGPGDFGHHTAVFFPETIVPGASYAAGRVLPAPDMGLHTIAATFHQSGVAAYFCAPEIDIPNDPASIRWSAVQLGLPTPQKYAPFPGGLRSFSRRTRKFQFLRYATATAGIPDAAVPDEFSKEHLRVAFQNAYMAEVSDVDGILWGEQFTYPLEIKEKTPAESRSLGDYFGLDLGPFVKLAFYAAKRGNLHSLFIVREIDDVVTRNLVAWWVITFDRLAQYASWNPRGGGTSMTGMASTVVQVPKAEFEPLDAATLGRL